MDVVVRPLFEKAEILELCLDMALDKEEYKEYKKEIQFCLKKIKLIKEKIETFEKHKKIGSF